MKKTAIALLLASALITSVQAGEGGKAEKKHERTAEQKALMKQILEKYDTNKDGKLDKDERAKMSAEDKAKLEKAGIGHKKEENKDGAKKSETK